MNDPRNCIICAGTMGNHIKGCYLDTKENEISKVKIYYGADAEKRVQDIAIYAICILHKKLRDKNNYIDADKVRKMLNNSGITVECYPKCNRYYKGMKLIYEG